MTFDLSLSSTIFFHFTVSPVLHTLHILALLAQGAMSEERTTHCWGKWARGPLAYSFYLFTILMPAASNNEIN